MPSTRVIATVAEPTHAALCAARDERALDADLVELRLDALGEPIDVQRALRGRTKPVVATCRPRRDGGQFDGSEEERRAILAAAMAAGAEYVDLEWRSSVEALSASRRGRGIVLSMHDFERLPNDLGSQVRAMAATGAEVVKVAVTVSSLCDCTRLADAGRALVGQTAALVGMGAAGIATRLLPGRFGSSWTYAGRSAPGQIRLESMLSGYRVREVRSSTAVYGVAGHPVTRSLSPAMHNAWFAAGGIDAVYLPLDTESADDLFAFSEWLGVAGLSITAPLKQAVVGRVRTLDAMARRVGAVNTIKRSEDGWDAINTDVEGFRAPLAARNLSLRGRRAAVLGAGGAARAAAVALGFEGADVSVHARRLAQARQVANLVSGAACDRWPAAGSWDLLVNATPAGWQTERDLITAASAGAVVYDLVSSPLETPLLARARAAGCSTIPGVEMLVAQAEAQAEWWTGRRPDAGLMMRTAQEALLAPAGAL